MVLVFNQTVMRRGRIDVGLVLAVVVAVLGCAAEGFVVVPSACRFQPARSGHVSHTRAATPSAGAGRVEGAAGRHWGVERGAARMRSWTSAAWTMAVRDTALQACLTLLKFSR